MREERSKGGRPPKTSWDPCARCSDPDGAILSGKKTPARLDASRWGFPGKVCHACYQSLRSFAQGANDYSDLPAGLPHSPRAAQIWRSALPPSAKREELDREFPRDKGWKVHPAKQVPVLVATRNRAGFVAYKAEHQEAHPEIEYFNLSIFGTMYDMNCPIVKAPDWEGCPALADPIFAAAIARGRLAPFQTRWQCHECSWEGLEKDLIHWRAFDHLDDTAASLMRPDGPGQCPWCERSDKLECLGFDPSLKGPGPNHEWDALDADLVGVE